MPNIKKLSFPVQLEMVFLATLAAGGGRMALGSGRRRTGGTVTAARGGGDGARRGEHLARDHRVSALSWRGSN
jgi:hypothetical protein